MKGTITRDAARAAVVYNTTSDHREMAVAPHEVQVEQRTTRAEVLRRRVKVDLATDEIGPEIALVLKDNGIELAHADWTKVFPHWLVATVDGKVVGCLQVMPAKPVAWCEFLYTKKSTPFKFRALAVRALIAAGMATAYHSGCQYVAGMVDIKNQAFSDVLKKLNFVNVSTHTMMAKVLKD